MTIKHLVISGGGENVFYYIGIFKHLLTEKYLNINDLKSIYATSSGTMMSVLLLLNYDMFEIENYMVRKPWNEYLNVDFNRIMNYNKNKGLYDSSLFKTIFYSLLAGKDLSLDITLKEFYEYSKVEFHLFTVELNSFELVDLSYISHPECKLLDALNMSCAFPSLISPFCIDDKTYIDGGALKNYPIEKCIQQQTDNSQEQINEILGFRNIKINKNKNIINSESSVVDYIIVLVLSLFSIIINKNNEYIENINHNYIKLDHSGVSIEGILNIINYKEKRIEMINKGVEIAKNYINN